MIYHSTSRGALGSLLHTETDDTTTQYVINDGASTVDGEHFYRVWTRDTGNGREAQTNLTTVAYNVVTLEGQVWNGIKCNYYNEWFSKMTPLEQL